MKGRQSRYVTGGESFAEIARRPGGTVVISRSGRKCRLSAGTAEGPFAGRRQGTATHLFVAVL